MTSCKLSRAPQPLVMLLMECVKVGELAAEAGIVDVLIDALVDTWLKTPSKLSPTTSTPPALVSAFAPLKPLAASPGVTSAGAELLDEASLQRLCGLPQDWLVRLLSQARERGVRLSPLADLAMRYVYKTFVDKDVEQSSNAEDTLSAKDNREERSRGKEDSSSNLEGDVAGKDSAQVSTGVGGLRISEHHTELEHILDAVLMVLPEEAYNVQSVSMECLTTVSSSHLSLLVFLSQLLCVFVFICCSVGARLFPWVCFWTPTFCNNYPLSGNRCYEWPVPEDVVADDCWCSWRRTNFSSSTPPTCVSSRPPCCTTWC